MILFNYKKLNKKIVYLLPFMIIIYFFCIKSNYMMMDKYSFFNKISMYDMYIIIMNDPIIELIINLPLLLVLLTGIGNNNDYLLRVRFKSRKRFGIYKVKQVLFVNMLIAIVFVFFVHLFGYFVTGNATFNFFDLNSPMSILFNNSKKMIDRGFIDSVNIYFIEFLIFFIRNVTISIITFIISNKLNLVYSFIIAIIPFLISAFLNGNIIHCYMLDINNINNIILLVIKLFFITLLLLNLIYIFLYLEERIV